VCQPAAVAATPVEPTLVTRFQAWLRKHRGASDATIKLYARRPLDDRARGRPGELGRGRDSARRRGDGAGAAGDVKPAKPVGESYGLHWCIWCLGRYPPSGQQEGPSVTLAGHSGRLGGVQVS